MYRGTAGKGFQVTDFIEIRNTEQSVNIWVSGKFSLTYHVPQLTLLRDIEF